MEFRGPFFIVQNDLLVSDMGGHPGPLKRILWYRLVLLIMLLFMQCGLRLIHAVWHLPMSGQGKFGDSPLEQAGGKSMVLRAVTL